MLSNETEDSGAEVRVGDESVGLWRKIRLT